MNNLKYITKDFIKRPFGDALQVARKNETLTMNELAIRAKLSQSYISQLENGVRLPSDKVIKQLADALSLGRAKEHEMNYTHRLKNEDFNNYDYSKEVAEERSEKIYSAFITIKGLTKIAENKIKYKSVPTRIKKIPSVSNDATKLINIFMNLSEDKQKNLLEYAEFLNNKDND